MYVVKDNNPDVTATIVPPVVVDAEGFPVPGAQQPTPGALQSDNPSAVSVEPDADGDPLKWTVHFGGPNADGSPAVANLTLQFTDPATGEVVGSLGAQVTVTAGDPAAIKGGSIVLGDLVEAQ